mmetsp:Transcript_80893/g.217371  ORF Transcript_80893/g.217371 Transcript_80893/m.217371 type:complete len:246 (+) Transcript_80893:94-831(+)
MRAWGRPRCWRSSRGSSFAPGASSTARPSGRRCSPRPPRSSLRCRRSRVRRRAAWRAGARCSSRRSAGLSRSSSARTRTACPSTRRARAAAARAACRAAGSATSCWGGCSAWSARAAAGCCWCSTASRTGWTAPRSAPPSPTCCRAPSACASCSGAGSTCRTPSPASRRTTWNSSRCARGTRRSSSCTGCTGRSIGRTCGARRRSGWPTSEGGTGTAPSPRWRIGRCWTVARCPSRSSAGGRARS